MMMPQIQLQINDIKMNLQPAAVTGQQVIKQPQADLKIEQPAAIIEMHTTNSELRIDQSRIWQEMGLLSPMKSVAKYAQDGKQANLDFIAQTAREGDQMMLMSGKGHGFSIGQTIAKQNHGPQDTPVNITFIPSGDAIDIHFTKGTLDINVRRQEPRISAQVNKPIHQYTPSKVSYTMLQRPSVHLIDVIK